MTIDFSTEKVYWVADDNDTIRRMNLDGSSVTTILEDGTDGQGNPIEYLKTPSGIAVGADSIFFTDREFKTAKKVALDGSGTVRTIYTYQHNGRSRNIVLDRENSHIYWVQAGTSNNRRILRANLNGDSRRVLFRGTTVLPGNLWGIALDKKDDYLYWTETTKIRRVAISALNANTAINGASSDIEDIVTGLTSVQAVAVDTLNNRLYWGDSSTNKIQRAEIPISGAISASAIKDFVSTNRPFNISLDLRTSD